MVLLWDQVELHQIPHRSRRKSRRSICTDCDSPVSESRYRKTYITLLHDLLRPKEPHSDHKTYDTEDSEYRDCTHRREIPTSSIRVAETIDHPCEWIPERNGMKYPCKSRKWIKDSSEVREWGEKKCRDDIYLIEVFRVESIDKTKK